MDSKNLKLKQKRKVFFLDGVTSSKTPKIRTITRPSSNKILPCKAITLNKKYGFNNKIILKDINNLNNEYLTNKRYLRKCLSSSNSSKNKKVKLKTLDNFDKYLKGKSPIDLLVEKKERNFENKMAHKKFSCYKILEKFLRTNFKNERDNFFHNKYFYIKSKLNINTKSSELKTKNNNNVLVFDDNKFKLFNNISQKIKKKIQYSSKKLDVKNLINKIKKEKKQENLERIAELKNVIEDKKILLTPKNFMKNKKDPFLSYKINEFIQSLNANFTYQYRYILAKNFDIEFDKYLFSPTKYDNYQRKK
jgi:hypothetical protein